MHGLNGGYTNYFNRKYRRVGHLFQGRYKAIIVEKDRYLIPLSRYVHLNPVRAGVVERPEKYRWSSYPGYIGKIKQEDWVEDSWVLFHFGRDRKRAERKYREYTEEGLKRKIEAPLKDVFSQVLLGGEEFIHRLKKVFKGRALGPEIIGRKKLLAYPTIEKVLREVAKAFGVEEEVIRAKGGRDNQARRVALYFAHRYTELGNEAIGAVFGGIHFSTVSKASARLREEMVSDKKLLELINNLYSNFKA